MKSNKQNPFLLAAITLSLAAPVAIAAPYYWDIDGATPGAGGATPGGTWGNSSLFWSTDSTGSTATTAYTTTSVDDLFFSAGTDATGSYNITFSGSQTAKTLRFEDGTAQIGTVGGASTLTLAGGGDIIVDTTATGATISSAFTINGNNTFNVKSGKTLTVNGTSFTRGTRATLNVQGLGTVAAPTGTGTLGAALSGTIAPWASVGTGATTTYATLSGGNIVAFTTGTPAATAAIVTDTGGTFNYDVAAIGTLGAGANINTLRYTGAAGTIAGDLTTKGIMNAGTGTLIFSNAVTAGAAGTELVVNTANANITFSGIVTGAINKTGSGTMTLGNVAHSISNWTANEGVLVMTTSTNDGLGGGTINNGGTMRWGGNTKFGNTAVYTINAGGTFDMNGFTDLIGGISGSGSVTNSEATALLQLGNTTQTFSGVISGGLNLLKRNGGEQILSGANTFTGTTTINTVGTTATLTLANPLALQNSALNTTGTSLGTATTGLKTTVTTLTLGGLIGDKNLASVFRQDASGGPSGTTALGGYSGVSALTLNPAASVLNTYSGEIADGALGMTLTKTGAGTQVLSGANSYTGGTTVTAGILQPTLATALADYTSSDKVVFNGGTIAVVLDETAAAGWSTPQVDLLLANATKTSGALGIDTSAASVSFAPSNLSGPIGLTKLGTNTLTLTGNNTYSANTTISAGTLRLENTGAVQNSPLIAIGGNTLEIATDSAFSGPNISMQAGTIVSDLATPGAGLTHVLGNATIGNGVSNFTAGANVTSGTAAIQLGNISNNNGSVATPRLNPTTANLIITGGVTLGVSNAGTANLVLDGTGSVNSIAGAIVNGTRVTGNVIKTGTSTWTLSGLNTYTGDTTVNEGVLAVTGTSIPNTGKLLINGSGIVNLTGTETVAALDFDGTPQPDGTYSATSVPGGASITTASFSGGGTLTVGSVAGFSAWQLANGTAGTIDQDHDNDGVDNGVEFFIYGPVANSGFTALPGVDNTGGTLSVTWTKAAGYTGAYNTDYVVETSTTLTGPWTPAVEGASPGQVLITGNDVKYTFPAGTKNFARLNVTGP